MSENVLEYVPPEELRAAVDGWEGATLDVLRLASSVTELSVDEVDAFVETRDPREDTRSLLYFADPAAVYEGQVEALIERTDVAIGAVARDSDSAEEAASRASAALTGNLNTGFLLLAAAEEPGIARAAFGQSSRGVVDPTESTAYLDELKYILFGVPLPGPEVPAGVSSELEKLEAAGGKEFRALASSAIMWSLLGTSVKGFEDLDKSGTVKKAFDEVRHAVHWLRKGAVRLIEWTVGKLRDLVPERFQKGFDEKVEKVKDAFKESADDVFDNAVGVTFGRLDADRAWQKTVDAGVDVTDATTKVGPVVATHVNRIGWVSKAREAADGAVTLILKLVAKLTALTGPWGPVIVGALALAVFALIGFQLWDGFNDVEALAPAPQP